MGQSKLQQTIEKSKQAFYEYEAQQHMSWLEFLYQQGKYIHKRWWVIQGLLLFILWWVIKNISSDFYIRQSTGILAPVFVILVMPEFWKNKYSNAMEVECTTFYSLRQIYAVRMILFGLIDLLLVSIFFITAAFTIKTAVIELVIQFFVPFNVTCCICFRMLYAKNSHSEGTALLLCMLWIAVWTQIVLYTGIYNKISVPVWIIMLAGSVSYLGYCVVQSQKKCQKTWEEKPLWS